MADLAETQYQKLARYIGEVEQQAKRGELELIDISGVLAGSEQAAQPQSYGSLVSIIEDIEGGRKMTRPQPVQEAQPQPQPQQPQPGTIGVQPQPGVQQQKEAAGRELGGIVDRLAALKPAMAKMTRKRINVADLVMPSLSVSDQISELERIMEGLKEGVFDAEHREIVEQEVYGLQQVVSERKKGKGRAAAEEGELDQSLTALRDQRLADAIALLGKSGAG